MFLHTGGTVEAWQNGLFTGAAYVLYGPLNLMEMENALIHNMDIQKQIVTPVL